MVVLALSQTTGYAIQALACLTIEGESKYVRDLAADAKVPAAYLSKIVQRLNRAGILISRRGYLGGVQLARPANAITLLEICEAVDGPLYLGGCLLGLETCTDERACSTHAFWTVTRAKIRETLGKITLAGVAEFEAKRHTVSPSSAEWKPRASRKRSARKPARKATRK